MNILPGLSPSEIMVISAVALVVVGPKDLPVLLRKLGQLVARLRGMANDFRASFDEMARHSELEDLRKEVAALRDGHSPLAQSLVVEGGVGAMLRPVDTDLSSVLSKSVSPSKDDGGDTAPAAPIKQHSPRTPTSWPKASPTSDPARPSASRAKPRRKSAS